MPITEWIGKIKKRTVSADAAGRAFFAQNVTSQEANAFLSAYLDDKRYEELAEAVHCGFINKEYNYSDYLTSRAGALDLDARYFHLLLEIARYAGFNDDKLIPLFAACFSALAGTYLGAWKKTAEAYLLNAAYRDFDRVLNLLTEFDPSYETYVVLMQADKKRTEEVLMERLLQGKNVNKTAIRRLLLQHKINVSHLFGADYKTKDVKTREAIVRLALLYKNDAGAAAFLESVKKTEPLGSIRRLIAGKAVGAAKSAPVVWSVGEFEQMMINGGRFTVQEFRDKLDSDPVFYAIALELFFSVYTQDKLAGIVIVHGGKICDLENNETVLPEHSAVGVLHPLELPNQYEFLKRMSIAQPFCQILRPLFIPNAYETSSNVIFRMGGTVISAGVFRKNLKKFGFKLLYGLRDGAFDRAAVFMGDYACVQEFTPTDFSLKSQIVTLGEARFYHANDFISVHGKLYIEGVPTIRTRDLNPRMFSEFVYTLYQAGNVSLK